MPQLSSGPLGGGNEIKIIEKTALKTLPFICLTLVLSCRNSTEPSVDLVASVKFSNLVISNQLSSSVHYAIFERNSLALIDWIATCNTKNELRPSSSLVIPIAEDSFKPSNEAVIFWWRECGTNGGGKDIRSIGVMVR